VKYVVKVYRVTTSQSTWILMLPSLRGGKPGEGVEWSVFESGGGG
jgi:hypothetical protein